jgi:hypothetical protein
MEGSNGLTGTITHLSPSDFRAEGAWATRQSATASSECGGYARTRRRPSCRLGASGQFGLTAIAHPDWHTIIINTCR